MRWRIHFFRKVCSAFVNVRDRLPSDTAAYSEVTEVTFKTEAFNIQRHIRPTELHSLKSYFSFPLIPQRLDISILIREGSIPARGTSAMTDYQKPMPDHQTPMPDHQTPMPDHRTSTAVNEVTTVRRLPSAVSRVLPVLIKTLVHSAASHNHTKACSFS